MEILEAISLIEDKLAKTSNWKLRKRLCDLTETMSNEVVPFDYQVSQRRFRDASDSLLCAYHSSKKLIELIERWFPDIKDVDWESEE